MGSLDVPSKGVEEGQNEFYWGKVTQKGFGAINFDVWGGEVGPVRNTLKNKQTKQLRLRVR